MSHSKTNNKIGLLTAIFVMSVLFASFGCVFSASAQNSYGNTIYLKTDKTSQPYIHYWSNGKGSSDWPGVKMESVSGKSDLFSYKLPCDIGELTGVIFNSDGNGTKMTEDVTNISGNLYTLSTGTWSVYDTSSIKIKSFGGTPSSEAALGQKVELSVEAEGGNGTLQYQISVSGAKTEILSSYSNKNKVTWTPSEIGEYTVTFDIKDSSGESNQRQLKYTIIDPSIQSLYGKTVYLKTDKTTQPYIHYWSDSGKGSSNWPGVPMKKAVGEKDVYYYDLPCNVTDLTGIIFNSDSSGTKITGDLKDIKGNLYDTSTDKWSIFDTSSIRITAFGGVPESELYSGQSVALSINAEGGDGNLQYKISVSGSKNETISDYSKKNTAVWTPNTAGEYTVTFDIKDGSGETNKRQLAYNVKDSASAVEPVFLGAVPANKTQIKKGETATVTVKGSGGNVNNNVLFYKAEILDPNGNTVNEPYYSKDNTFSFKPDKLGNYTVYMYIQNNTVKNTTVKASYTYSCVENPSDNPEPEPIVNVTDVSLDKNNLSLTVGETDVLKATVSPANADDKNVVWSSSNEKAVKVVNGNLETVGTGTSVITVKTRDGGFTAKCTVTVTADTSKIVLGDFNGNGKVELDDAKSVQNAALGQITLTPEQKERCDVNKDGKITLKDAALIKQVASGTRSEFLN